MGARLLANHPGDVSLLLVVPQFRLLHPDHLLLGLLRRNALQQSAWRFR